MRRRGGSGEQWREYPREVVPQDLGDNDEGDEGDDAETSTSVGSLSVPCVVHTCCVQCEEELGGGGGCVAAVWLSPARSSARAHEQQQHRP